MSAARQKGVSIREHILEIAGQLFYRDGFRAVGIDTIIAESEVAKMTLYRHFPSKDDLIVAYLEQANRQFWQWLDEAVGSGGPRDQLVALFEGVAALATSPTCLGCTFQTTAAEFPAPDHPGHQVAQAHKQAVRSRLLELAERAGARHPAILADQLLLLMDGAFVAARMFGPTNPAAHVAEAAATLIQAGCDAHASPA